MSVPAALEHALLNSWDAARQATTERPGQPELPAWPETPVLDLVAGPASGDGELLLALAEHYDRLLALRPGSRGGRPALVAADVTERRRRGSFATPPDMAEVLARHALPQDRSNWTAELPLVVDPAVGAGALLAAAFERLLGLGLPASDAAACLHGVDLDPVAAALCRARLLALARRADPALDAGALAERLERQIVVGDALLELDWAATFPDVLAQAGAAPAEATGWRGGFDAVLANPPWERIKVFRRELSAGTAEDLAALRDSRARTASDLRSAGRHPLTGAGELNAYLPFVETCWRLLHPGGRAGLVVPSGIASDRSAAPLMHELLQCGALAALHLMDASQSLFAGVSARVSVAVIALRSGVPGAAQDGAAPRGEFAAEVAVGLRDVAVPDPQRCWQLRPGLAELVNPMTATLPLCRSSRDAELLARAHRLRPVLGEGGAQGWQVRLVTPLHMTRDAGLFRAIDDAELEDELPGLLPLWEAKHAGLLDPTGGNRARPRYWVEAEVMSRRYPELAGRGWLAGYRNVTTADAVRTLLPTPIPVVAVGNSLPLIDAPQLPLLLAALASLPVDHLVRQKHAGANLNFFKLLQAALPPPGAYAGVSPFGGGQSLADWVLSRFAAAVAWGSARCAMPALRAELGAAAPLPEPAGNGDRAPSREDALADLDAVHALLFDWDRSDLEHVLGSFPALADRERKRHGEFVTRRRVLAAYDRLAPSFR